ncbi:helix-turn-helix domain-containing protein [Eubacterium sp. MSJ-33]|uniref:helix-turn-helix domain-containing protein n=1 Tax=Eubacterium sp. MSJ-33 TaxID=2841528 RepID=UPI001C776174|nr:helix-turn-helix domain-containing protein [Eubacterium sp. MSJ-33]
MQEEYYTVAEIQKILRIGRTNVYDLIRQPDFPKTQLGNKYLIPKSQFENFMKHIMYKQYKY